MKAILKPEKTSPVSFKETWGMRAAHSSGPRLSLSGIVRNWGLGFLACLAVGMIVDEFLDANVFGAHLYCFLGAYVLLFAQVNKRLLPRSHYLGIVSLASMQVLFSGYFAIDRRLDFETEKIITGSLMVTLVLICALYSLRKKLAPFAALGLSRNWRQFHIYAGAAVSLILLSHINFQAPVGLFSNILFYTQIVLLLTSLAGLVLQKWIPLKLSSLDCEAVYETIPFRIECLREDVLSLLEDLKSRNQLSKTLSSFCEQEVLPHFKGVCFQRSLLFSGYLGNTGFSHKFDTVTLFLKKEERRVLDTIRSLCFEKHQLDIHHSLQWVLRWWLGSHIVLSSLLIVLIVYHLMFLLIY